MPNMFKSATFKLTVWYMAIIVLVSLVFSLIVYRMAVSELKAGLSHQSARLSSEFPAFSSNPQFRFADELKTGRRTIIANLGALNAIVFVCAGFASYGLARRTLEPIERSHKQQTRFTADVSHELRTPLTALKMESEVALMNARAGKKELRDAIKSNIEEADKMEQLVANLLRLTKLESDELAATFTSVAVKTIIESAVLHAQPAAAAKNISLDAKPSSQTLKGDEASLTQLLIILLENAIKYSGHGGQVSITNSRHDNNVQIEIKDSGVGIEPEALKHVFERFYRADKARTGGDQAGYGLGLSIAKYIADLHDGTITLKSRPGHGTTAIVTLPNYSQ